MKVVEKSGTKTVEKNKTGLELVLEEVKEKIYEQMASKNKDFQMSKAAIFCLNNDRNIFPRDWDLSLMAGIEKQPTVQRLVMAAALIIKEADRLQAEPKKSDVKIKK